MGDAAPSRGEVVPGGRAGTADGWSGEGSVCMVISIQYVYITYWGVCLLSFSVDLILRVSAVAVNQLSWICTVSFYSSKFSSGKSLLRYSCLQLLAMFIFFVAIQV